MVGLVAVVPCLRVGEVGAVGEGAEDAEPLRISRLGAFTTFSLQLARESLFRKLG